MPVCTIIITVKSNGCFDKKTRLQTWLERDFPFKEMIVEAQCVHACYCLCIASHSHYDEYGETFENKHLIQSV